MFKTFFCIFSFCALVSASAEGLNEKGPENYQDPLVLTMDPLTSKNPSKPVLRGVISVPAGARVATRFMWDDTEKVPALARSTSDQIFQSGVHEISQEINLGKLLVHREITYHLRVDVLEGRASRPVFHGGPKNHRTSLYVPQGSSVSFSKGRDLTTYRDTWGPNYIIVTTSLAEENLHGEEFLVWAQYRLLGRSRFKETHPKLCKANEKVSVVVTGLDLAARYEVRLVARAKQYKLVRAEGAWIKPITLEEKMAFSNARRITALEQKMRRLQALINLREGHHPLH